MSTEFDWFVGIDRASQAHEVCILNASGKIVERRSAPHTGDGLTELADRLAQLCHSQVGRVAVSIEVPHGAVVETLLERGFAVFSLNPKQLDRFRDRFSPAGAKDDRRDALVLADSLRTDRHCFRRLAVDPAHTIRLRELARMEDELKEELVRLSNRLREQLRRYYPQVLALSPAADDAWVWELLSMAPTPAKGRALRQDRIERLLRCHRIRRLSSEQVRDVLQATPLTVAPGTAEAASEHIEILVPQLQLARNQVREVQRRIGNLLDVMAQPADPVTEDAPDEQREHRDVAILLSAPGVGRVTAATMLAQAGRAIKDRDYHAMRSQAGLAPVTKESGKSRRVEMRRACDRRLRRALYHVARTATMCDESARTYYRDLRKRGHSHGRALRSVADRHLRILCAMLRDGTLYDPSLCLRDSPSPARLT